MFLYLVVSYAYSFIFKIITIFVIYTSIRYEIKTVDLITIGYFIIYFHLDQLNSINVYYFILGIYLGTE